MQSKSRLKLTGVNGGGMGGCIPQHFGRGDAMPLIPPCCDEFCMNALNGDIYCVIY